MPEDRLQLFQVQRRSNPEHAPPVEASVRYQDMAVGIESEEVAKGLDGDDGAGDGILFRHRLLKKELQRFPGAATQIGKKIPVIVKKMVGAVRRTVRNKRRDRSRVHAGRLTLNDTLFFNARPSWMPASAGMTNCDTALLIVPVLIFPKQPAGGHIFHQTGI